MSDNIDTITFGAFLNGQVQGTARLVDGRIVRVVMQAPDASTGRQRLFDFIERVAVAPVDIGVHAPDEIISANINRADQPATTPDDDKSHPRFIAGYTAGMKDGKALAQREEPSNVFFPAHLRKMWSGSEVQAWLNETGPFYLHPEPSRDWPAVNAAIDEFIEGYEVVTENDAGQEGTYTPTADDRHMLTDCIHALLSDDGFLEAFSRPEIPHRRAVMGFSPRAPHAVSALLYVLSHHTNPGSSVGLPLRALLGICQNQKLTADQLHRAEWVSTTLATAPTVPAAGSQHG